MKNRLAFLFYFIFHLIFLFSYNAYSQSNNSISIVSGNNQNTIIEENSEQPLVVKVLDRFNKPVFNEEVKFELSNSPEDSKGFVLKNNIVKTDSNGIAKTYFTLGNKEGKYKVTAKINLSNYNNNVEFSIKSRKSNWVILLIIGLIGGVAIYLYGMMIMSDGMKKIAGSKLRTILNKLTKNRFLGVLSGIISTVMVQSSSAVSVLTVSMVQIRAMTFSNSIGILLGAGIGTTITAQLIAFNLADYALLIVGIGFTIYLLSNDAKQKNIGLSVFGFGLLFFGLKVMASSMEPLKTYEPFISLLYQLNNPVVGIILGFVFTALIHSSAAFIGVVIALSTQGIVSLEAGIPLLLGSNIGTTTTAILASIGTSREAKRVAIAFIFIKIVGVLAVVTWIPTYAEFIREISPTSTNDSYYITNIVPHQIANAHTVFNVFVTLGLLPFTNLISMVVIKIFPEKEEIEKDPFEMKYLDDKLISTPAIAVSLAKAETLRMSDVVRVMLNDIIKPFENKDSNSIDNIEKLELEVDFLRQKIHKYLTQITQQDIHEEIIDELFQIMYTITELEEIGDMISGVLLPKAKKWNECEFNFSEQGKKELLEYHNNTIEQFILAIDVFRSVNLEQAKVLKESHKKYMAMTNELKKNHFMRICENIQETTDTSKFHMEIMGVLRIINSHSTNIGRIMLDNDKKLKSGKNK